MSLIGLSVAGLSLLIEEDLSMETNKTYENYHRRQAKRLNLLLEKSYARKWYVNNQQGWRIIDPNSNTILAGEKYELTIEEAAKFLDEYEIKLKSL
jgi:hypothetical protein